MYPTMKGTQESDEESVVNLNPAKSREFRRRLVLFVEGVAAWEPHVTHLLAAA